MPCNKSALSLTGCLFLLFAEPGKDLAITLFTFNQVGPVQNPNVTRRPSLSGEIYCLIYNKRSP